FEVLQFKSDYFIRLSVGVFQTRIHSQRPSIRNDLDTNLIDLDDNIPGRAGIDYPTYHTVPKTNFKCLRYEFAGYFGDPETGCQAFHVCFPDGRNASFLCVNGTVFHQRYFVCDWWFHFNCSQAPKFYEQNKYRRPPLPVLPPAPRKILTKPIPEPKKVVPPKPRTPINRSTNKPGITRKREDPKQKSKNCYCPCR
ncbi:uncharacterized protein LOC111640621, partial [Centruroides sculpturatus]|uniref:uncharacterized protein LOC111640621 n=1 Tax=Centruroides sculpturatus TaxID=218467 RepID=UPI000C6CF749